MPKPKHLCLHGYSECVNCPACCTELEECPICSKDLELSPAQMARGSQDPERVRLWLIGQAEHLKDRYGHDTHLSDILFDGAAAIQKLQEELATEKALVHFYKKTEQYKRKRREASVYALALGLIAESCANPKRVAQEALDKFK